MTRRAIKVWLGRSAFIRRSGNPYGWMRRCQGRGIRGCPGGGWEASLAEANDAGVAHLADVHGGAA